MTQVTILQMPGFKKSYKKLHDNEKELVDDAINEIVKNPEIGEEKKGELTGIFVYKFKLKTKEFLLAYEWDPAQRILLALGVHENFYRDLKKKL